MSYRADQPPADLPGVIRELIDEIGLEATMRLVDNYGGLLLRIPREPKPGSPMERRLGQPAFDRLIGRWAGDRIWVPRCVALLTERRDQALLAEYEAGTPSKELARKFKVSDRHVWRILARSRRRAAHQRQRR